MMPCGPRAVPTGGAGFALPAGICNFTNPVTFFAIQTPCELSAGDGGLSPTWSLASEWSPTCGGTVERLNGESDLPSGWVLHPAGRQIATGDH